MILNKKTGLGPTLAARAHTNQDGVIGSAARGRLQQDSPANGQTIDIDFQKRFGN